jgi:hypothetical protein
MKWKIIVKKENINETYMNEEEAGERFKEIDSKYKKVAFLSLDVKEPPEGFKKYGKKLWCPYCGEKRQFTRNTEKKVSTCSWCGISVHSYYVKKFNDLWGG